MDLIEDQKAFEEAVKIGFFESDILPLSSNFAIEMTLLESGLVRSLREDEIFKKLLITQRVLIDMVPLTQLDYEEILQRRQEFINKTENQIKKDIELEKMTKALGEEEVEKREKGMNIYANTERTVSGEEIERLKNQWPYSLVLDESDQLTRKLIELANPKIQAHWERQRLVQEMRQRGVSDTSFVSVLSPDGFIVDMCIPQNVMQKRSELIRYGINFRFLEGSQDYLQQSSSFFSVHIVNAWSEFEGYPVHLRGHC